MNSNRLFYGDIYRTLFFHNTNKLGNAKSIIAHDLVKHHALLLQVRNDSYISIDDIDNIIELIKMKRRKHFMKTYPSKRSELYVLSSSIEPADLFNIDGNVTLKMVKENIKRNR